MYNVIRSPIMESLEEKLVNDPFYMDVHMNQTRIQDLLIDPTYISHVL
jgi:hypothetical protein